MDQHVEADLLLLADRMGDFIADVIVIFRRADLPFTHPRALLPERRGLGKRTDRGGRQKWQPQYFLLLHAPYGERASGGVAGKIDVRGPRVSGGATFRERFGIAFEFHAQGRAPLVQCALQDRHFFEFLPSERQPILDSGRIVRFRQSKFIGT